MCQTKYTFGLVQPRMLQWQRNWKYYTVETWLLMYGHDTHLVCPLVNVSTVQEQLNHITDRSGANNLRLNYAWGNCFPPWEKLPEIYYLALRQSRHHLDSHLRSLVSSSAIAIIHQAGNILQRHMLQRNMLDVIRAFSPYVFKILLMRGLTEHATSNNK